MKKFTLIELLIVVAIIGILVSLLMPSLRKARYMARIAVCQSNIKQNGTAMVLYNKEYDQAYPDVMWLWDGKPYKARTNYQINTSQWYNFGVLYKIGLMTDARTLYCPQHEVNNSKRLTYEWNTNNGEFGVNPSDWYIRTSYSLLWNEMTYSKRKSIRYSQLENDDLLINSLAEEATATAHKNNNKPGWNVMKADLGVKFVRSSSAWSILKSGSAVNSWPQATKVKEALIK